MFEDEKDIIIDSDADIQISDDGTVSWDDILDDDDSDEIVSVKEQVAQPSGVENPDIVTDDDLDDSLVDLGDELEFVEDEDDVDDEELNKILSSDNNADSLQGQAEAVTQENFVQEEFDLDEKLATAAGTSTQSVAQEKVLKDRTPRSEIKIGNNAQKSNVPFLIGLLVVLVIGGFFYYDSYLADESILESFASQPEPKRPPVQQQMDQVTKEDIAQRVKPQEEIPVVNEEEVSEVKPEVQLPKDKKETVAVVQTGRGDPFLPLSKYTTLKVEKPKTTYVAPKKVDENIYLYGDVPIEKPVAKLRPVNTDLSFDTVRNIDKYQVTGIVINKDFKSAVISVGKSSYFVKIGDVIDGLLVEDINKDYVLLVNGEQKYEAYKKIVRTSKRSLGDINFGTSNRVYSNAVGRAFARVQDDENASDEEVEVNERN